VKQEESFAMTLRQIWRFFRDRQIIGHDASIAELNRVYYKGTKNQYTLLGQKDKHKFPIINKEEFRPTTTQDSKRVEPDMNIANGDELIVKQDPRRKFLESDSDEEGID
jgi:hypothetical protein